MLNLFAPQLVTDCRKLDAGTFSMELIVFGVRPSVSGAGHRGLLGDMLAFDVEMQLPLEGAGGMTLPGATSFLLRHARCHVVQQVSVECRHGGAVALTV